MILLVGLGNPGSTYSHTRHNIGFMAVDAICHRYNFSSPKVKFTSELREGTIDGERVISIKPLTYMNNSGIAVREAAHFYKIPVSDIIACHDDLDLPLGKIKTKTGGGHGGHNGLRSIDSHLGKEYQRLRIGIGHPGDKAQVTDYVLGRFAKQEEPLLEKTLDVTTVLIPLLIHKNAPEFLNKAALLMAGP